MEVFLEPVLLFFELKKNKIFENFSSKNKFPQSSNRSKKTVPNTMAMDPS